MSDPSRVQTVRRSATPLFSACVFCAAFASSCTNPLGPMDADYGKRTAAERLRRVDRLDRDRYAAPKPAAAEPPPVGEKYVSRFAGLKELHMSLEEARAAALTNNVDLKVALVDPTIQSEALRQEEAKFEAVFRPFVRYDYVNQPTLDKTAANQQTAWTFGGAVDVPLRGGGRASVDFTENLSHTNNTFFTINTAYDSALTFSLSQPLLRNAGRRANSYSIRIASYNRDIAESRTKLEVIRQLANADRAYWRLYAARRGLEVRQIQYELAMTQLERARRRFQAGDAPELEVTRAESGVASQLEQIIEAEKAVLDSQRDFKRLLNIPGLEMETATQVITTNNPDPVRFQFDGAGLADLAVGNRMEMLELELRLAQDFATIEFNKNQALPLFTLDFQYQIPGLGPTLSESIDQLADRQFRTWSVALNGQIPLGNEAAKARVQQSILTRLQRLSSADARRLAIRQEVLAAVDAIDAAWQRIMAARQAVILAARTYEGEKRQFDAGARTSTDVLNAAAVLADDQTNEVRALTDYEIAQVDLAFATGTLLGASKIDWTPSDPRIGAPAGGDPTPFVLPFYADPDKARKPAEVEMQRAAEERAWRAAHPPPEPEDAPASSPDQPGPGPGGGDMPGEPGP